MNLRIASLALGVTLLATTALAQDAWYKVRVAVPTPQTLDRLLESDINVLDCHPGLGHTDAIIGPGDAFKLGAMGLGFEYVAKVQQPGAGVPGQAAEGLVNFAAEEYRTRYFNADEVIAFYETLRAQYPTYVTRRQIGTSINGEAIWAYRIGRPIRTGSKPEASFVLLGLTHAREWVNGTVPMHVAVKTIEGLTTPQARPFLTNQLVWIVPILNPDGYRYTWTDYRLWRKNRRNNGGGSFGVDLNRNYAKGWGGSGSSGNVNSETYRGTAAFSEPETAGLRDFVATLPRVAGVIDWHSYSQKLLWPWSYTTSAPPTRTYLNTLAGKMVGAMTFGANYQHGQGSIALYVAGGTSKDYFYDAYANAPSFTLELRDTGQYGFELPPQFISPTQDEGWAAFKVMLTEIPGN